MQEKVELLVERTDNGKSSLRDLLIDVIGWWKYILSKWYIIIIVAGLGAAAGFSYALTKKDQYIALTSFVLESGGARAGASAYAGIASTFGIDLGASGGGLFEGENILELYKSRKMITTALLSDDAYKGGQQLLIDRYVEMNGLKEKLGKDPRFKNLRFRKDNQYSNAEEQLAYDGLIGSIVDNIKVNYLKIDRKEKKINIMEIAVTSPDELFSKQFNERIVNTVNDFYLQTKTKKALDNLAILQSKTDSVRSALSGAVSRGAAVADATPNQNPTRMAQRVVPVQSARINAEISQQSLTSLIQNLEMSKISLMKETPLIQIVDSPILPLGKTSFAKTKGILVGGLAGAILTISILIVRKFLRDIMRN